MNYYLYSYEDEASNRYIETEIYYDTVEPVREPQTWSTPEYYIPGEINITNVNVVLVDYYNSDGSILARLRRSPKTRVGFEQLDREMRAHVEDRVYDGDQLWDALWDARELTVI